MFFQKKPGGEWLIVGLGNPGSKYWNTRHNVGYAAMDALAESLHARVDRVKFQGLTGTAEYQGHKLVLLKPTTYMNLSGRSVAAAAKFYKIPPERILVMLDDISLEPGRLRVRKSGSAGGHNGLKSVIERTGTPDFVRLRLGVGRDSRDRANVVGHVLGKFSPADRRVMDEVVAQAVKAIGTIELESAETAMNRYNGWAAESAAAGKEDDK